MRQFEKSGSKLHTWAERPESFHQFKVGQIRGFIAAAMRHHNDCRIGCVGEYGVVRVGIVAGHRGNLRAMTENAPAREQRLDSPGVGPHPLPWPQDARLDEALLEAGDARNVVDEFRYWSHEAIVEELQRRRHPFHVAIENWEHDFNIGTVVRNANAFGATAVHIVGRKRWNRRGAMVTDRYQTVHHHPDAAALASWASAAECALVGIDNLPGSRPIETTALPQHCVLLFGQEGPGLSEQARQAVELVCSIAQFGSTRSINAGVASGIAMHSWIQQHVVPSWEG